jgi:hypothetical protein
MKKVLLAIVFTLLMSSQVSAAENNDFHNPTLVNIVDTWVKYSDDLVLADRGLLDSYIALNYCEEKKHLFKDDISREAFRNELKSNFSKSKDKLPHLYRLVKTFVVENYDFDTEELIISEDSSFRNMTSILLPRGSFEGTCKYYRSNEFKKKYIVDIQGRIDINKIPMSEEDANNFVPRMQAMGDGEKLFFVVVDIDLQGVLFNAPGKSVFKGEVLDIGYYTGYGEENRFGGYDFAKENEKYEIDYLEGLDFIADPEKATY